MALPSGLMFYSKEASKCWITHLMSTMTETLHFSKWKMTSDRLALKSPQKTPGWVLTECILFMSVEGLLSHSSPPNLFHLQQSSSKVSFGWLGTKYQRMVTKNKNINWHLVTSKYFWRLILNISKLDTPCSPTVKDKETRMKHKQ